MTELKVGDKVPDFECADQNGKIHRASDYLGMTWAIYFYPKDNTPGCTQQACSIRDNYAVLQAKGVAILGVSMDSESSHQKFTSKYELPFPLLVDTDRKVIDAFGVWGEKKFMGKIYDGIHRTTFIINETGSVIEIIEKPKTKIHAEEILNAVNKERK